jgi:mannose-6-phosphate isomerase-like protein (cupin superfamily)
MTLSAVFRPHTREHLRDHVAASFPDCPEDLADQFVDALDRPAEDLAARAAIILDKPYGRNHILAREGTHGLSLAVLQPGQSTSLHFHEFRRELFCVRSGTLHLTNEGRVMILQRLDCARSTPGIPHSLANGGPDPLEILEIFAPALLDDKVRVEDRYDRKLGAVGVKE